MCKLQYCTEKQKYNFAIVRISPPKLINVWNFGNWLKQDELFWCLNFNIAHICRNVISSHWRSSGSKLVIVWNFETKQASDQWHQQLTAALFDPSLGSIFMVFFCHNLSFRNPTNIGRKDIQCHADVFPHWSAVLTFLRQSINSINGLCLVFCSLMTFARNCLQHDETTFLLHVQCKLLFSRLYTANL